MSTITINELEEDNLLTGSEELAGWDSSGKTVKILLSRIGQFFGFIKKINNRTPDLNGSLTLTTGDISDAGQDNKYFTQAERSKLSLIKTDGSENRFLNEKGQYVAVTGGGGSDIVVDPTPVEGSQNAISSDFAYTLNQEVQALGSEVDSTISQVDLLDTRVDNLETKTSILQTNGAGTKALHDDGTYKTVTSNPTLGGELSGTASNATISGAAVIGKLLSGLGSVSGTLLDTDSIVQAFSKVKYFIANIGDYVRSTLATGLDTNLSGEPSTTDTFLQLFGKLTRKTNANTTLAKTFYLCPDYAGLSTTARFPFSQKFTITGNPTLSRIATVNYQINTGTVRTLYTDINSDIAATTTPFELTITVTFSSGENQGNLSLPCIFN